LGRNVLSILDAHGAELHTLLVRLTLRPDVADDLLQDLFLKLSDSLLPAAAADPRAYVRRMAINLAFDWRRQNKRLASAAAHAASVPVQPPPWLTLANVEEADRILGLAADLPALGREAFVLHYVHEQDYRDIGRTLGRSAHQARALCHAAVRDIRSRIGQQQRLRDELVRR